MFKLFKAMQYQYYWEKMISKIDIYVKKGVNPSLRIYKYDEFILTVSAPNAILQKFPMSTEGFKTAIKWIGIMEIANAV